MRLVRDDDVELMDEEQQEQKPQGSDSRDTRFASDANAAERPDGVVEDSGEDDSSETVDAIYGAPPSAVEHTLAFLADTYQFVVVDCPPGLTEGTRACIAMSEQG